MHQLQLQEVATTERVSSDGWTGPSQRRYASPLNLPVIMLALACWAVLGAIALSLAMLIQAG